MKNEEKEYQTTQIKGYALYDYPLIILKIGKKVFREVFYNPSSDYGYWKIDNAINYTDYILSNSNFEEWRRDRVNLILFDDPNYPDVWKDESQYPNLSKNRSFLLFQETTEADVKEDIRIFGKKGVENKSIRLIDRTDLLREHYWEREERKYIGRRDKAREMRLKLQKEVEEARKISEELEVLSKKWQFNSKSSPGKKYTVKIKNKDDIRFLSCNCPIWIYNKRKNRTCSHTDMAYEEIKRDGKVKINYPKLISKLQAFL